MLNNILDVPIDKCTGCLVCLNVCPKHCIIKEKDALGFYYPKIKKEECINCGLCKRNCPELNKQKLNLPKELYGALWNNKSELEGCSSGGIASLLAKTMVMEDGVYYGVISGENGSVKYERFDNVNDIKQAKGSKYVQSDMESVYLNIKDDLKCKKVLFVGSPCQCAALDLFCKDYLDNLYLVSFPCGGWASNETFKDEIKYHIGNEICDKVIMRNRRNVSINIYKNDKLISSTIPNNSYFMTALDNKLIVRKSCWNCTYSCQERVGDIVLGDYWGAKLSAFSDKEIQEGISFIGTLTNKGNYLLEKIKPNLIIQETNYMDIKQNNPRLNRKIIEEKNFNYKKRLNFEKNYTKRGLKNSVLSVAFFIHLKRKTRGIVKYYILSQKR